jgi:hypothetical protein
MPNGPNIPEATAVYRLTFLSAAMSAAHIDDGNGFA